MDEEFGLVHFAAIESSSDPQVTALLYLRIRAWLNAVWELAEEVLRKHRKQVDDVAKALLREEMLDGRHVMKMVVPGDQTILQSPS